MNNHELIKQIETYIRIKGLCGLLNIKNNFVVSFLAQGEYNINFIIEDNNTKYVFRINTGSQIEVKNQIKYEYDALKVLEISGVTPKVYYVDYSREIINYGLLIMEYLHGRPLKYDTDLLKAARIFSQIHTIDASSNKYNNFIIEENLFSDRIREGERLLKEFFLSPIPSMELKRFFTNYLEWCYKNRHKERYFSENKLQVINNTEVNSHNFIIGEKAYLIDWEKPVISDPCQDLTQFLAPTTTLWRRNYILSKDENQKFIKSYAAAINKPSMDIEERINLYNPYLYLRALSWCAYAYVEYKKEYKTIKNNETFKKIELYLERNFLKSLLEEYNIDF
ncbi:phosphotransferase [Clostridium sp.]|uniref:phosphotransferase n=1 Tax=Clostridium sp. TaxID=1506 RepID=UPI002FC85BD8